MLLAEENSINQVTVVEAIQFDCLCDRIFADRDEALALLDHASQQLTLDMVEMGHSVAALDFKEIARLGHKMRGTAANLTAEPLRLACDRLEMAAKAGAAAALPPLAREFIVAAERFLAAVKYLSDSATSGV